MPGIGFLSSIDYNADMQASFNAGLNANPPPPPYTHIEANGGYHGNLHTGLNHLLADSKVTLIVTFGGLMPYREANTNSTKQFISLIGGRLPGFVNPPSGNFIGCCDLQSIDYTSRITWLSTAANFPAGPGPFSPENIGLLYNSDSDMADNLWPGAGQSVDDKTTPGNFAADFGRFHNTNAVIISADANFHKNMDPLIHAANTSQKYICYPFPTYQNLLGHYRPTHGNAVIIGPDLDGAGNTNAAYYLMGVMASAILRGVAYQAVVPVPWAPPQPL
jgi:hypothetical protein